MAANLTLKYAHEADILFIDKADACLVRMSEILNHAKIFTLDSNFHIYRKNRSKIIPCIIPVGK